MQDRLNWILGLFGKERGLATEAEWDMKESTNVFFHNSHICTSLADLLTINVGTAYRIADKVSDALRDWNYSSPHIYFDAQI